MNFQPITATLIKKIKDLARELKISKNIPLHEALEISAVNFGFLNYHQVVRGLAATSSASSMTDRPPSSYADLPYFCDRGLALLLKSLKGMNKAIADDLPEDVYLEHSFTARYAWWRIAMNPFQGDLADFQCKIALHLDLCFAYYKTVAAAIDMHPKLDKYEYSGTQTLNFILESWADVSPMAQMEDKARRNLLNRLRSEYSGPGEIRISRLAPLTHKVNADIASDQTIALSCDSAFHLYNPPPPGQRTPLGSMNRNETTASVIVTLAVSKDDCSSWYDFDDHLHNVGGMIRPLYETRFLGHDSPPIKAAANCAGDTTLCLGDVSWGQAIIDLESKGLLPPLQGNTSSPSRSDADPFVVKLVELGASHHSASSNNRRMFKIFISPDTSGSTHKFAPIGITASPALAIGWIDEWLSTIRVAGKVSAIEFGAIE